MEERYPEKGELVLATVERVTNYGAFVRLDEYGGKQGIVTIKEFTFKWVKHPRDYLREGQKAVLKVLRVNRERGHIDLSLKNVSEIEKREKLKSYKLENRAKNLISLVAKKLNRTLEEIYPALARAIARDYGTVYNAFIEAASGKEDLKKYISDEAVRTELIKLIKESIKPPRVEVSCVLDLSSLAPDGIIRIKSALREGEAFLKANKLEGDITYISSPHYRVRVVAEDYKTAERYMKGLADAIQDYAAKHEISFNFARDRK